MNIIPAGPGSGVSGS